MTPRPSGSDRDAEKRRELAWGRLIAQMRLARLMGLRVQLALDEDDEDREMPTWYVSVVDPRRAHGTMPVSSELLRDMSLEALALGLEHAIQAYQELFAETKS